MTGHVRVVPANEASWEDVQTVFGSKGYPAQCQCQRFKSGPYGWSGTTQLERMRVLQRQTHCDNPDSTVTSGLVAYLDDEPVAWCAVEPRIEFPRLPQARVAWKARGEVKDDPGVWAVTCFTVRAGFRGRGLTRFLLDAAVDRARSQGAKAIEGYPMINKGEEITWGEIHVGARTTFAAAGFREVAHPTLRRVVMRIDF